MHPYMVRHPISIEPRGFQDLHRAAAAAKQALAERADLLRVPLPLAQQRAYGIAPVDVGRASGCASLGHYRPGLMAGRVP